MRNGDVPWEQEANVAVFDPSSRHRVVAGGEVGMVMTEDGLLMEVCERYRSCAVINTPLTDH